MIKRLAGIASVPVRSPLFLALALTAVGLLVCSKHMSHTFFHYCPVFDRYTLRKTNVALRQTVLQENAVRINRTIQFLTNFTNSSLKHEIIPLLKPGPDKDVLITVITVDRFKQSTLSRPSYFAQTVARLLQEFAAYNNKARERALNVGIVICDVDYTPIANEELQFVEKMTSLDVIYRHETEMLSETTQNNDNNNNNNDSSSTTERDPFEFENIFHRENQDYIFCLNSSLHYAIGKNNGSNQHPRYVLALEDDAPPVQNYFDLLEDIIRNRLDRRAYGRSGDSFVDPPPSSMNDDLLYTKLFHPDAMLHFHSFDAERLPRLLAVSVLLAAIFSALLISAGCCSSARLICLFAKCLVYFVAVTFLVGRPNIVRFHQHLLFHLGGHVTLVPAPSCCTPAILFPQSAIPIVTEHMASRFCSEDYAKDGALDELRKAKTTNRSAWLVQPNLHSHIGHYSAVRHTENESYRQFIGF